MDNFAQWLLENVVLQVFYFDTNTLYFVSRNILNTDHVVVTKSVILQYIAVLWRSEYIFPLWPAYNSTDYVDIVEEQYMLI